MNTKPLSIRRMGLALFVAFFLLVGWSVLARAQAIQDISKGVNDPYGGAVDAWDPSVAIDGDTVIAVWADKAWDPEGNYDIFLARSVDGGEIFSTPINLSKSPHWRYERPNWRNEVSNPNWGHGSGSSQHPVVAVKGDIVLVAWADHYGKWLDSSGTISHEGWEVYLSRSEDGDHLVWEVLSIGV